MANDLIERIRQRAYEIWEGSAGNGNSEEHWLQAEHEVLGSDAAPAEAFHGDGAGREGTRAYDEHATKFGANGSVEQKVKEAEQAIAGPEREELKRAEQIGKSRAKSA
jgi:hypothetical protein